ncbi:bacteriocin-like protein [Chryseobacterium tongliaoense]|uniref:bacteriocin-like protein n=1 Tax=Chryseobacterium tongliaoense TaxID=3240933 RepID=UPI0035112B39
MKNLKKLSKNELKNVLGGVKACSVAIQKPDGSWVTHQGICAYVYNTTSPNGVTYNGTYYCNTGTGNNHVITSNGGISHCND